ncbi:integral membrane sensor signal transduction histidine kinase [Anaeromyxobacter sp. K]|uniref:sensor histidine kinase n=1 Tax=Anaeromyxobacter sp. (strain K) TaxID=447217 RepID=UPI00015F9EBD|nr:ATP-binding protein [Anaeromyxobacter sp. K]ACG74470.1 integral membrane sensor signal transduction histidine kinase [Anaeromyxobacter sp. K]
MSWRHRPRLPRLRLWVKLALLAAVGVVVMHAAHLALGNRIATRAIAEEEEVLGRTIARLVAEQAADPVLLGDPVTLFELVSSAARDEGGHVAYCFIVRDGRVVATSFAGATPARLVALRPAGDQLPVVVASGNRRVLDLVEPILDGSLGEVRLGLDLGTVQRARRQLAVHLGLLAVGIAAAGLAAALLMGRSIARPIEEVLAVADRFDPSRDEPVPALPPRGGREIAVLRDRFHRMLLRLRAAHEEQVRVRQKSVQTERLAALGSLVAGVAHEVNNPLAGLKNCVRRLERGDLPPAKEREYFSLMGEGLQRIEEVVQQLLEFGRPHPPRLEPIAASRLAQETLALVRPALDQRRVAATLLGGEDVAPVLADRRLAEQAVLNLLLNAGYVTPDGGALRVRLVRRDGMVGIAVEDDGPGIPQEVRDRILDPFFSTKPEGEGTGLGLSVTRTILDAHGGELTFDFPARGGTVATAWFRAGGHAAPGAGARA